MSEENFSKDRCDSIARTTLPKLAQRAAHYKSHGLHNESKIELSEADHVKSVMAEHGCDMSKLEVPKTPQQPTLALGKPPVTR